MNGVAGADQYFPLEEIVQYFLESSPGMMTLGGTQIDVLHFRRYLLQGVLEETLGSTSELGTKKKKLT